MRNILLLHYHLVTTFFILNLYLCFPLFYFTDFIELLDLFIKTNFFLLLLLDFLLFLFYFVY